MAIKGYKQLRANLNKTLRKDIPKLAENAAHVAGSIIGGYATLMTPIDTSNLVNSQYRTVSKDGTKVIAAIGYTAKYAAAVHEAPGSLKGRPRMNGRGNYWDPDANPKFLEQAATENMQEIDSAIKKAMKL